MGIVKTYQDSREIYHKLTLAYQKIDNLQINNISNSLTQDDLNKLTEKLKEFPQRSVAYTRLLRNLEDYQNTIFINAENYHDRLQQIHGKIPQENVTFSRNFLSKKLSVLSKTN
ncbi:MAG: hypothetical protein C4323_25155 [Mastigocladus sp. ERB_26_2]